MFQGMNPIKQDQVSRFIIWVAHIVLFIALSIFVIEYNKVPYTDDWYYVDPLLMSSWEELVTWIFAPHAEHRIPIQKAAHLGLLYLSGYDFRVLIFFNLVVASITSALLVVTTRTYRGHQHWGDLIIPLVILSPWSMWLRMSFQFQFLSSIFFVSAYLYFIAKYTETDRKAYYNLGLLQLLLCSFTGINGLIFATVLSLGSFAFFFFDHQKLRIKSDKLQFIFAFVVLTGIILHWVFFQSSQVTGLSVDFQYVAEVFIKLIPSSMLLFATGSPALMSLIIIIPLMFVGWYFFSRTKGRRFTNLDLVLGIGVLSSLAVVLSIPVGRGAFHGGWRPDLIMHYGCLTVLLPILAWAVISSTLENKSLLVLGFLVVGFFGFVFISNYDTRFAYEESRVTMRQDVYKALNEEQDIDKIIDKHILQFWYKDEPWGREKVKRGITALRKYDYPIYKLEDSETRGPVVPRN